jgi:predicted transcriptional regulator
LNSFADLPRRTRAFLAESGMSHAELAKAAGISQSTVTRMLSRDVDRSGRAMLKLHEYLDRSHANSCISSQAKLKARVLEACERIARGNNALLENIVTIMEVLAHSCDRTLEERGRES